jgi:Rps23 Pro-64 3,4-dihydroxylase Tpa1-like proline 4-hydroxylase
MAEPLFYFDTKKLAALAAEKRSVYAAGVPFPHIVIDNLIPEAVLDQVLKEFPSPNDIEWRAFKDAEQNGKLTAEQDELIGPMTRHLLSQLNAAGFMEFLDAITGIDGLIPDPYFKGGGLHQTVRGGFLGVHADFNEYKRLKLERRVNVLLYLNKDWKEEYGGALELWNKDMTACAQKIAPIFNRMVIFSTTDTAYHGHPDPLTCPPDMSRKSLALYYYTVPTSEIQAHSTLFRTRPGEELQPVYTMRTFLKRCIPPIVLDALRALRRTV